MQLRTALCKVTHEIVMIVMIADAIYEKLAFAARRQNLALQKRNLQNAYTAYTASVIFHLAVEKVSILRTIALN